MMPKTLAFCATLEAIRRGHGDVKQGSRFVGYRVKGAKGGWKENEQRHFCGKNYLENKRFGALTTKRGRSDSQTTKRIFLFVW